MHELKDNSIVHLYTALQILFKIRAQSFIKFLEFKTFLKFYFEIYKLYTFVLIINTLKTFGEIDTDVLAINVKSIRIQL